MCRSPRKENVYAQTQQDTLARLAATYGKHILCRRTLRARWIPWGKAWWIPRWRCEAPSFRPAPQVWACPPFLSPFSWGDSLRRVPAMDRPRPLHWCDAGTPTPAGTCVVLLPRPTRLLSHSTRVHGALESGSAFWIAAIEPVGSPCLWGFLLVMRLLAQPCNAILLLLRSRC